MTLNPKAFYESFAKTHPDGIRLNLLRLGDLLALEGFSGGLGLPVHGSFHTPQRRLTVHCEFLTIHEDGRSNDHIQAIRRAASQAFGPKPRLRCVSAVRLNNLCMDGKTYGSPQKPLVIVNSHWHMALLMPVSKFWVPINGSMPLARRPTLTELMDSSSAEVIIESGATGGAQSGA